MTGRQSLLAVLPYAALIRAERERLGGLVPHSNIQADKWPANRR